MPPIFARPCMYVVYANAKLSGNVKMNVDYLIADSEYACGGSLVDDKSYLHHYVVVSHQLTCISPIETPYLLKRVLQPIYVAIAVVH